MPQKFHIGCPFFGYRENSDEGVRNTPHTVDGGLTPVIHKPSELLCRYVHIVSLHDGRM